jgi:hypothetical protein
MQAERRKAIYEICARYGGFVHFFPSRAARTDSSSDHAAVAVVVEERGDQRLGKVFATLVNDFGSGRREATRSAHVTVGFHFVHFFPSRAARTDSSSRRHHHRRRRADGDHVHDVRALEARVGCLPVGEDLFKVVGSHALPVLLHEGNTSAWTKVVRLLCEPGDMILCEEFTFPSAGA